MMGEGVLLLLGMAKQHSGKSLAYCCVAIRLQCQKRQDTFLCWEKFQNTNVRFKLEFLPETLNSNNGLLNVEWENLMNL